MPPSAPPEAPGGGYGCDAAIGIKVLRGIVPIIISSGTSRSKAGPEGSTSSYEMKNKFSRNTNTGTCIYSVCKMGNTFTKKS